MIYLHLMRDEKPLDGVVRFYDRYFNDGNHTICYVNQPGKNSLIKNSLSINQYEVFLKNNYDVKGTMRLLSVVRKADIVVIHSMFINPLTAALLSLNRYCKKIIWIEWGFDLYNWRSKGRISFISNHIHRKIREQCRCFVGIFPPDCDYYLNEFKNSTAKVFYAPYCGVDIPEFFYHYSSGSRLEKSLKNGETIYIMVGHSASKELNHIEVLQQLQKFSHEDIKIVLPLSYGDKEYANNVQLEAEKCFGNKALILNKMMPEEEYYNLVDRVDVAIFNTQRQIGLANINRLIFNNTKIYMCNNNPMYSFFRDNGINIQDFKDLKTIDYSLFVRPSIPLNEFKFKDYRENYVNMKKRVELWKNIYRDC